MGPTAIVRRLLGPLALPIGILCVAVPSAAAIGPPTIIAAQQVGEVELPGVACPTTTQCTAVDDQGKELTFDPASSAAAVTPSRITAQTKIEAVACPSTAQCSAAGWLGAGVTFDPLTPGSPFSESAAPNPLWAISCPSSAQCTAVGGGSEAGEEVTFDPATSTSSVARLGGAAYMGVSCPSIAQCTAVTEQGEEVTFDPASPAGATPAIIDAKTRTWDADPARVSLGGVACPSTTQCTTIGYDGLLLTFNPAAPAAAQATQLVGPEGFGRHQIACPSTTQCTAIEESSEVEMTFDPGAPGSPTAYPIVPSPPLTGGVSATDIACPSTAQCTVVALGGAQVTFSTGAPQPSGSPAPPLSPAPPTTKGGARKRWTSAQCKRAYKAWSKKHRHATKRRRSVELRALRHEHGCSFPARHRPARKRTR